MRRFFPLGLLCGASAAMIVSACEDAPIELPPDLGGPTSGGTGDGDSDGDGDGDGDGAQFQFATPVTTEVSSFDDLQVGDLNGDGCADLVLGTSGAPPRVVIYTSDCAAGFVSPPVVREISAYTQLWLGDLDGDGSLDLLTDGSGEPQRIDIYLDGPDFALAPPVTSPVADYDLSWAIDLDGDGRAEVLTHELASSPPTIRVWAGPGDGTLTAFASSEVGSFEVADVGRIDADLLGDLATGLGRVPVIDPWLGQGDGTLASADLLWSSVFSKLVLADLDGDGRAELLTDVPGSDWRVTIYPHQGDGPDFSTVSQDLAAVSYIQLRAGDVDADGDDDVVLAPTGQPPRVMVWTSL